MGTTTFSGPLVSTAGFTGDVTGNLTGNVTGSITSTAVSTFANVTVTGTVFSFANVPTSDPSVAGRLWSNSGILTVSAG